jgi:hypothetical protein
MHRVWSSRLIPFPFPQPDLPQVSIQEFYFFLLQNHRAVPCAIDQIGEVVLQRFGIAVLGDVLKDLEYNGRVACGVKIDFLVVWDFTNLAICIVREREWLVSGCEM